MIICETHTQKCVFIHSVYTLNFHSESTTTLETIGRLVQVSPIPVLGTCVITQSFITEILQASASGRTLSCLSHITAVQYFLLTYFKAQVLVHPILNTTAHLNPLSLPRQPQLKLSLQLFPSSNMDLNLTSLTSV